MSRLLKALFLVGIVSLLVTSVASATVLPADGTNNRQVGIFRNVSGASTGSGTAFILQTVTGDANVLTAGDVGQEGSLGLDVTTTTSADSQMFVGCQLDDTCLDDGLCRVVTHGVALCRWAGSTDNSNTRATQVGTTTVAGRLGTGTLAGELLSLTVTGTSDVENNATNDNDYRWIWVAPDNN